MNLLEAQRDAENMALKNAEYLILMRNTTHALSDIMGHFLNNEIPYDCSLRENGVEISIPTDKSSLVFSSIKEHRPYLNTEHISTEEKKTTILVSHNGIFGLS